MRVRILDLQNQPKLWRFAGLLSSVVGLVCYGLSSSFKRLFGEWNLAKIILYMIVSLVMSSIMLLAEKIRVSGGFILRAHVVFLVIMLTSLYSFFDDKAMSGKPDTLSIISSAAFALASLCLSRQLELGFEAGLFNFFLGCLTVQLMKIRLFFAFVAACFCYPLVVLRSYLDYQRETSTEGQANNQNSTANLETATQNEGINEEGFPPQTDPQSQQVMGATSAEDHVAVGIETTNGVERVTRNDGVNEETKQSPGETNSGDNQQNIEEEQANQARSPIMHEHLYESGKAKRVWESSQSRRKEVSEIPRHDGIAWSKFGHQKTVGDKYPKGVESVTKNHEVNKKTQQYPWETNSRDIQQNIEEDGFDFFPESTIQDHARAELSKARKPALNLPKWLYSMGKRRWKSSKSPKEGGVRKSKRRWLCIE